MTDTMTRPAIDTVQHRSFEVRAADDDARTFTGIGVPYGEVIDLMGWREAFDPDSVSDADDALILWRHDEPIGRVTAVRSLDTGLEVTGSLSDTERGREAQQLLRDGVIRSMSIGFRPLDYRVESDDDGEVIVYTRVRAHEFSLVPFPAYTGATITDVRNRPDERNQTMTDTLTRADLDPLMDRIEDFDRSLTRIESATQRPQLMGDQWRSMGEFLKAVAAGDDAAAEFHREYTGGTIGDDVVMDTFVGDFIKFVDDRRKLMNLFTRAPLPADGMSVDYVRLDSTEGTVGTQAKEGDDLPGPFKVKLIDDNAAVQTWGGWTELSRQRIERSQTNYLNYVLRLMGIEYAKHTERQFVNYLLGKLDDRAGDALELSAAPDYSEYLGAILDAGDYYNSNGFTIDGLLLSPDWFRELMLTEAADGRPIMSVYGSGVNTVGQVNVPEGRGVLTTVPVQVMWGQTARGAFYDSAALETQESPGAPAQLQDENIVNLSKQFSLYGFGTFVDPFPQGLVPITRAGAAG